MSRVRSSFKILKHAILKYAHQVQMQLKLKGEIYMKDKDKTGVKIVKILGVVLILSVICIAASEDLRNSLLEIIKFVCNPLFWFLYLMAILAFLVLR